MTLTTQSKRKRGAALGCAGLLLLLTTTARAQSAALIHLVPVAATVGEGATAAVQLRIENVEGLYGLDIRLEFDPAAVLVVDADVAAEGLQTRGGDLLKPDFVVRNLADNEAGTIWFALTQLNPSEAVTGSGVVFTVTFRGKAAGASSPLTITYHRLASRSGDLIPASAEDGEIRVVAAQEAPPTPTTAPTVPPATATPTTRSSPTNVPAATATPVQPTAESTSVPAATHTAVAKATAKIVSTTAPAASVSATTGPTVVPPITQTAPSATAPSPKAPTMLGPTQVGPAPTETPAVATARGISAWLVVYAALFALGLGVAVIAMRNKRRR